MDTKRGLLLIVGRGSVFAYDVRGGNYSPQSWPASGASGLMSSGTPGFDYDPTTDKFVGWNGGNSVYILDPATKAWSSKSAAGGPAQNGAGGAYGRWRYAPSVNAFVALGDAKENVRFYKYSEGPGTSAIAAGTVLDNADIEMEVRPNPFKSRAVISIGKKFQVASCKLSIFDITGKQLETRNLKLATSNTVAWNASEMPAGVYLARLTVGKKTLTKPLFLMK
jgi:hypothetical protein